ncbi:Zinc finger C-x8-C-x5-C-x3-H type (and similar) family protein [Babesia bovis T2Bo]|uniref:C3H1-type domain-containing protein n=1 Tax=Babesia bovis TaxID=5865 RepID=A7ATT1_BABBO|nr:Zinc finger C-x8-C-x5-C-x3-H type (and similar) family protein [Babesia bovis T2Bo]EDO06342.1 Zinc finger C-x8-C-x5-C-x3-H type (and similar) family protein [Babesia bovis T2Bo]|eukprot:XP_001609910.1 hypothetical protein [Babesia bovis T2Bo]
MVHPYYSNIPYVPTGKPVPAYFGQGPPGFYTPVAQYPYPYNGSAVPPCPPVYAQAGGFYPPKNRSYTRGNRKPPPPYISSESRHGSNRNNDIHGNLEEKHSCEPCCMYFRTSAELSEHIDDTHVDCDLEGCDYSAPIELMSVHALKHVKNHKGEYVLESAEEIRKWVANRRNRHPLNRNRDISATEESTLERLLRDAHRKVKTDRPQKSVLYPVISKVKPRPSALLQLSDPIKYRNLLRQSSGPYSYRPSLSMNRAICQNYKRTRTCKFGDRCQYSHDTQAYGSRDFTVTKRPPTLLHVLKNDIYKAEKLLVSAIKTIVEQNFFD